MEQSYPPPLPEYYRKLECTRRTQKQNQLQRAHRWVYLLDQLKAGYHVLVTKIDNIFSKHHPMLEMELAEYDVYHVLNTKTPSEYFQVLGFTIYTGMGWFRSCPRTIQLIQHMVEKCGGMCDDHVTWNSIVAFDMGMEWNITDWHQSLRTVNKKDANLDGLLKQSFTGLSTKTGHRVMVWDREFAYRGEDAPVVCPENNWVSIPLTSKYKSYGVWDRSCLNEYSKMAATEKLTNHGGNPKALQNTKGGDMDQLNRTKIVGFINAAYTQVGIRWCDQMAALGYTEHVIITTDNQTSWAFETQYPQYRVEASYRPALPEMFWSSPYNTKSRKGVELIFAHRWVYLLKQLKSGYHILITYVDNIFSKYHPMSAMELSEFDVFHAFETKHPGDVFEAIGFVVCGGMGWFQSSPSTIQFVQNIVDRCGILCMIR
jgi:hypothetical protein